MTKFILFAYQHTAAVQQYSKQKYFTKISISISSLPKNIGCANSHIYKNIFCRFIKGSTNANELVEKKVHIWDGNGSREFLDSLGFTDREVNDLGKFFFT